MKTTLHRNLLLGLALGVGAVLTLLGIAAGQPGDVLAKAVKICLECVGIG